MCIRDRSTHIESRLLWVRLRTSSDQVFCRPTSKAGCCGSGCGHPATECSVDPHRKQAAVGQAADIQRPSVLSTHIESRQLWKVLTLILRLYTAWPCDLICCRKNRPDDGGSSKYPPAAADTAPMASRLVTARAFSAPSLTVMFWIWFNACN